MERAQVLGSASREEISDDEVEARGLVTGEVEARGLVTGAVSPSRRGAVEAPKEGGCSRCMRYMWSFLVLTFAASAFFVSLSALQAQREVLAALAAVKNDSTSNQAQVVVSQASEMLASLDHLRNASFETFALSEAQKESLRAMLQEVHETGSDLARARDQLVIKVAEISADPQSAQEDMERKVNALKEWTNRCDYPPGVTIIYWPNGNLWSETTYSMHRSCEIPCIQVSQHENCQARADGIAYHLPTTSSDFVPDVAYMRAIVGFSMESTINYPHQDVKLLHERGFSVVATTHTEADVQIAYSDIWYFQERQGTTRGLPGFHARVPRAAFVARNCGSPGRNNLITQLAELGVPIDSLGSCAPPGTQDLHNAEYSSGNKVEFLKKWRMYIAFENSEEPGYVSEKIINGYDAGCLNIYWGAPDVKHYIPPNSAIAINDTSNLQPVVDRILKLLSDKEEWDAMFKWRDEDFTMWTDDEGQNLVDWWKMPARSGDSSCRMCKRVKEFQELEIARGPKHR